jgi:hypothetical protein
MGEDRRTSGTVVTPVQDGWVEQKGVCRSLVGGRMIDAQVRRIIKQASLTPFFRLDRTAVNNIDLSDGRTIQATFKHVHMTIIIVIFIIVNFIVNFIIISIAIVINTIIDHRITILMIILRLLIFFIKCIIIIITCIKPNMDSGEDLVCGWALWVPLEDQFCGNH